MCRVRLSGLSWNVTASKERPSRAQRSGPSGSGLRTVLQRATTDESFAGPGDKLHLPAVVNSFFAPDSSGVRAHRKVLRTLRTASPVALLLLALCTCNRSAPSEKREKTSSSSSNAIKAQGSDEKVELSRAQSQVRLRTRLVAEATRLALGAEKLDQVAAGSALSAAAQLRAKSFEMFGKKVDALEAIELSSDAAIFDPARACGEGLRMASLRAQMAGDPRAHYRDLYILRERQGPGACRQRIDRALAVLAGFQPDADVLRQLREQVQGEQREPAVEVTAQKPDMRVAQVLQDTLDRPTKIFQIEPLSAERTARVVVHVSHPTKFSVGALAESKNQGPRLFVDIEHASFSVPPVIESKGVVKRIRLGKRKKGARVVLDLSQKAFHRVFYLPEPFRLIIDLSLDSPEISASPREIRRVVLDPGHGGHDPGAVGPNGLREKDVALDIAHRAAPLLAREVGVSTLLTRDVDSYVPLDERSARANAFHADLFISIHLNASADRDSRGVMSFVLDASRDSVASKIAARENASSEAAAAELANSLSRIESVQRRTASETFAALLQRATGASLRQKYDEILDHGVRSAGFYVLAGAAMPAVLFEGSFISNPVEARRLNQQDYRQRLADSIVNAVRAYRAGL